MTVVLVTTANGDTGRPMVDDLLEEGLHVRAMVRKDDARTQRLRDQGAEVVFGDLLNFRDVRAALTGAQRAYFNCPVGEGRHIVIPAAGLDVVPIFGMTVVT